MIEVRQQSPQVKVVSISGRLEASSSDQLETTGQDLLAAKPGGLVFDLSLATFMDSTGLSAIVKLHRALVKAGCAVAIHLKEGPVLNLFQLTRLDVVFNLCPSLDEALGEVSPA